MLTENALFNFYSVDTYGFRFDRSDVKNKAFCRYVTLLTGEEMLGLVKKEDRLSVLMRGRLT